MDRSKLEIMRGVWLDSRRAVFLEETKVLCVADLHLGYHWAHRHAGQMLPIRPDTTPERLQELCKAYQPEKLAVLGDIIHRHVPVPEPQAELRGLMTRISACSNVELITGNHDRNVLEALGGKWNVKESLRTGPFVLAHGDRPVETAPGEILLMGHEHPAIHLGDGVRGQRFPCFVCGPACIILPAFSDWAGGADVRYTQFMSEMANRAAFTSCVAIMGDKLLKVPYS